MKRFSYLTIFALLLVASCVKETPDAPVQQKVYPYASISTENKNLPCGGVISTQYADSPYGSDIGKLVDNNVFTAFGKTDNLNNTHESTWWQKDVSFLRLKQLTFSYNLPSKWMKKTFMEEASIYLMGTNLLTFSNFKLWDPELNTDNGSAYPNAMTISVGVNVKF